MGYRKKEEISLELTPLIDVVFLLLIFFMISTTFSKVVTKLDLKLPSAKAVVEQKTKDYIIEVSADEIAFNGETCSLEELNKKLKALADANPDEVIILKADKKVDYGRVIKVIGLCKSHKLNRLAMAALSD